MYVSIIEEIFITMSLLREHIFIEQNKLFLLEILTYVTSNNGNIYVLFCLTCYIELLT